jgi:hypothetical protein
MSISNAQYLELFEHLSRRTEILQIDDRDEITAKAVEWLVDDESLRFAHIDEIARNLSVRDCACLAADLKDLWHNCQAYAHEAWQDEFEFA